MPNRLANSSSPYLLKHAGNPVDWYPWGEAALLRARADDKPIFLSIGYASCHWCSVMERESFEDEQTAGFMNEHFVNIKVDREQRPDLDAIYMQATVAMTGSGGWPMSVFLTPDLQPFYAGTYFPPVPRFNMPSFQNVLEGLARAWHEDRGEILRVGGQITAHIQGQARPGGGPGAFTVEALEAISRALQDAYDWGNGGWGAAPKFPQPMMLEFVLRRALTSPAERDARLKLVTHALEAMSRGGLYDVVGGGFARYSTDNFWRVPHFEKMLYDNAQLASIYLHAWQVTGRPAFRRVAEETLEFVVREMTNPDGGFYSSLDADSEGEEGQFYVWTLDQVREVLREEADFFIGAYGVTERGNWEGHTVLQRALDDASLSARFRIAPEAVPDKLAACHARLLSVRAARARPATDDKVLAAWNGLMLAAFAEAARFLDREDYLQVATRSADFLLTALRPGRRLRRAWRHGSTTEEVFLEDYAAIMLGLLELYQTDFDPRWFASARELADEMIERFQDPAGGFFDTAQDAEQLLLRPKDIQDNAVPSGNALACEALLRLAAFTDRGEYRDLAERALALPVAAALQYPTSFGRWLCAADFALAQVKQVAVVGAAGDPRLSALLQTVRAAYRPNTVVAASSVPPADSAPPLLHDRPVLDGQATAYVCEGFVCRQPVRSAAELETQL